jgi:hypothetical protein
LFGSLREWWGKNSHALVDSGNDIGGERFTKYQLCLVRLAVPVGSIHIRRLVYDAAVITE